MNSFLEKSGMTGSIPILHLALPLGISFYTFQSIGYLIDVYREKFEPERNPAKYALFVSFFPQLIQGPISFYDQLTDLFFIICDQYFSMFPLLIGQNIFWYISVPSPTDLRQMQRQKTNEKNAPHKGTRSILILFRIYQNYTG